jgi:pilus assembly protein CpaB
MGKYRPFIFLGLAVVVALIASVLVYNLLQKRTGVVKEVALETQPIAVAIVDMPWGSTISRETVKMEPFLKNSLPAGYISDPSLAVGRVLVYPIKAREPILESRLAPATMKVGGIAAVITQKKRAVAVRVDKVIGVAGFIKPNNRVDVLVTLSTKETGEPVTKTVLENMLVLAVGTEVELKGKDQKPTPVDVITLEVTPEEAEKLALAATQGKLQLTLRSSNDTEDVLTRGASVPLLLASYVGGDLKKQSKEGAVRVYRPYRRPAPKPIVVELIRGGKLTTVKFAGGK